MSGDPLGSWSEHPKPRDPPLPAPELVTAAPAEGSEVIVSCSNRNTLLRAAKRQRTAETMVATSGKEHASATRTAPCCCRWLSDVPESTARSFEVWLSTEQLLDHLQTTTASGASNSELVFCWRISCEKHIPFCVKELCGQGTLASSSDWRRTVNVDLSRSGYGLVTLTVTVGGADRNLVSVKTVREVCTDLPLGRSMTRAPPPNSTAAAGARPPETWAGEHRWHDFAANMRKQRLAAADGRAVATNNLRPISHTELAKHRDVGDGWVAVGGLVFDVSEFLSHHPGGVRTLLGVLGVDATEQFNAVHPQVDAEALMSIGCFIKGRLVPEQSAARSLAAKLDD